jgi:SulP family sulfate permease
MATPGSPEFVALAALLALVVGGARLTIGIFRLGWMAFLLSQPVLMGFTAAAALLIIGSQLPGVLGVEIAAGGVGSMAFWAVTHPGSWEPTAVVLSLVTAAFMFGSRRIHPVVPGVLLASLAGWGYSFFTGYSGPRVGEIPVGILPFSLSLPWTLLPGLILPGIVIAMVGFAEPASVALTYATMERRPWNPNREFVSQGVANLAAGLVGGFPVGGSFSRTSLNYVAGARTRWSGFVAGAAVLLFLPFASVLGPLPKAVLASVVISAVWKLIRLRPLLGLWRLSHPQAVVGWTTFGLTLLLAPHIEEAVILAVALALGLHLWRELTPGYTVRFQGDALHLELRGVLWFGSAPILEKALLERLAEAREARRVVLHLEGLGRIDLTGALFLKQLREDIERAGMVFEMVGGPSQSHAILGAVLGWRPEVEGARKDPAVGRAPEAGREENPGPEAK